MASKRVHICIFEDEFSNRLLPLSYLRPVYDLRVGMTTIREKIERFFPRVDVTLHCRSYLAELAKLKNPDHPVNEWKDDSYFFVNGRVIADDVFRKLVRKLPTEDVVFLQGSVVVAASVSGDNLNLIRANEGKLLGGEQFGDIKKEAVEVSMFSYPWDLIQKNGQQMVRDFKERPKQAGRGKVYPGVHLLGKKNIFIGKGAVVKPSVVLDAEEGPIYIDEGATILPQATIIGPAFIGAGSMVKAGAQIYGNTSIGPVCKIGGEVEACIIHGYTNKQHSGFLGHSYLGEWVNLGADTNNSDLKNNYSTVKVDLGEEVVDTKSQFVGLMMGDHSKSGINTMFNTGTVVGICSNVFGSGFPSKFIPSFSWGGAQGMETFDVEKAIEIARRVMRRRNVVLSDAEEKVLRSLFARTASERERRHGSVTKEKQH